MTMHCHDCHCNGKQVSNHRHEKKDLFSMTIIMDMAHFSQRWSIRRVKIQIRRSVTSITKVASTPPTPTLVHMVRVTFASSSNKCTSSVTSSKSDQIIIYSKLGFTCVKGSRGMWTYVGVLWEMHQWTTRTAWVSYILRRTGVLNKNMYNWETKVTFARLWCLSSR